jgi:chloride channel protein, CIC family
MTDEAARLTPVFWVLLLATAVATGLLGSALMFLLTTVEHLAFGYDSGTLEDGAEHASAVRRVASLVVAGAFGGVAWYLLRRYVPGRTDVDEAVWRGDGELGFRRSLGTSVLSIIVIGMGVSLGREAAPKLMGAAFGSAVGRWAGLSTAQLRLLVACGGGAGLAAVYNVPLGGALFTAEILLGSMALPVVLPALACSVVATAVGWVFLGRAPTYPGLPDYPFLPAELVWAALAGPLIGLVAVGLVRMIGLVSHYRPRGGWALVAPLGATLVLGLIGIWLPQLFGNGKGIAHDAFLGVAPVGLLVALALLKPLVTTLCLGSGMSGGLFTPVLSTGAAFGGVLGAAWSLLWPGVPNGAYAMLGAAALIGAAMQAPLSALVLVLELTHVGFGLVVPMTVAVVLATAIARWVDGYSIYSARLSTITP